MLNTEAHVTENISNNRSYDEIIRKKLEIKITLKKEKKRERPKNKHNLEKQIWRCEKLSILRSVHTNRQYCIPTTPKEKNSLNSNSKRQKT